ncbi:hypothetical protein B0H17DRAFT_1207488 [Mycena rosella]|uniref:FAD-binding domain-containing protein n=1 Tax=Mycena rosella TaxID=1033263 RepID=A0AAD7D486_MYCRO|nr:hypothetical protein B0H17DRAFT_1207488 [Mycena rosella]
MLIRDSQYGILCHRSDLHELKCLATAKEGTGPPATLHLKCDAISCDPATGTLTLKSWNAPTTKEQLLGAFSDYDVQFTSLLELVNGPVHLWQIRAFPCLPTWTRGCAALIGDVAHATQGAAISIEDAVTIACLLPRGTTPDAVPRRLQAYQSLRKDRGEFFLTDPGETGVSAGFLAREMQALIVGHDAVKVAQEYLATHFSVE